MQCHPGGFPVITGSGFICKRYTDLSWGWAIYNDQTAGLAPQKWWRLVREFQRNSGRNIQLKGIHPSLGFSYLPTRHTIRQRSVVGGGGHHDPSHGKNPALLSMSHPGWLMTGSFFMGLWNNPFFDWVGYFFPNKYPKQPGALFSWFTWAYPSHVVKADPSRRDLMGMTPLRVVLAQEIRGRRFALVGVEVMVGDTASEYGKYTKL